MRSLSPALSAAALAVALTPVVPAQATALPVVQFVKIYYNSPGSPDNGANSSLNGEWARLKNTTRKAIDLTGWTLRDKTSAPDHVYTFGTFILGAGKTVTVRTGKGRNTSTIRHWGRSGGTFAYIWNQTADTGYIHNPSGKLIDSCSYNNSRTSWVNCLQPYNFASTALAEGVPISEVSRWLGHESITTTVDLYGHLVPEASERARTALSNAFAAALHLT